MQIEIKDPVLGALVGALIASANTIETVAEKIEKHFPGGKKAFKKLNNGVLSTERQRLFNQIAKELREEGIDLHNGTAPWCVPKEIGGHDITYSKDGVMFNGNLVDIKTMKLMLEACKNAN